MNTEIATGWGWMEIEDLSFQRFFDDYFCGSLSKRDTVSLLGKWGLVVKVLG
jgi:hypothetical protein